MKLIFSKKFVLKIIIFVLFVLFPLSTYAAEVYYLGQAGQTATSQPNPSYSLSQRFHDLLNFSAYGEPNQDRSGRISGKFTEEISWQDISGNTSKSFLERGTDYLTELNLNLQEKLGRDYNFEGQGFLRKTDNRRIETKRELRLKQLNLKALNSRNLFEFGDFYADFSQFVLGSSLEGFNIELNPSISQRYHFLVARKERADTVSDKFQRNTLGAKADYKLFQDSELFSNFRIGMQVAKIEDDSSTIDHGSSAKDLSNTVAGIDGEISLRKAFSLQYELARSGYIEDEDGANDKKAGTAFRLQPALNLGKANFRYLYYYVQPQFYTETGSASPDKIQHQLTFDYRLSDRANLNFVENLYWDHLDKSTLTKRTTNNEKYLSFILRPFEARKDFTARPYINYSKKDSDDDANSAESVTKTIGFSINDTLNEKTTYGVSYEYRAFVDEANKSTSDYFHRLGFNLGHEQLFFEKRLYYSLNTGLDLRSTKTDDNKDASASISFSGQYDMMQNSKLRFGHNLQDANSAKPASDSVNHRSFLEMDFLLAQKRASHFVLRAERNRYDHEDNTQEYNETRAIAKFITNF